MRPGAEFDVYICEYSASLTHLADASPSTDS
jgi:hypothetical protein